jgi:copper resistance protein B
MTVRGATRGRDDSTDLVLHPGPEDGGGARVADPPEPVAPYWVDVEAAAFISNRGEASARLELEYDLLVTQRLIVQPRLETNIAIQEEKELGIGQGVNELELGLRLRYEIRREFAPYIRVAWTSKFGEAADFARAQGDGVRKLNFVVGIRCWF